MSILPFTRLFEQAVRPDPRPPADARELLGDIARHLAARGVACVVGRDALWARLPGREVRIDATDLPRPALQAAEPPEPPEGDAAFLSRMDRQDAAERARIERDYPLGPDGEPAWDPRRRRIGPVCDGDATEVDEVLRAAIADEPY